MFTLPGNRTADGAGKEKVLADIDLGWYRFQEAAGGLQNTEAIYG